MSFFLFAEIIEGYLAPL